MNNAIKNFEEKKICKLATNCSQLKLQSVDGKFYNNDVAEIEQLFRVIKIFPSLKAEGNKTVTNCSGLKIPQELKPNKK